MFGTLSKFDFRNKQVSYDYRWLDDDTFIFEFGDGEFVDSEGYDYFIHFEYHVSDDKWIIEVFWDSDSEIVGFDGSDEYITGQEVEEVKKFVKQFIIG